MGHQQFTLNRGTGKLFSTAVDSSLNPYFQATRAPPTIETNFLEGKDVPNALQSFDPERAFRMLNQKLSEIATDHQEIKI